MEALLAIGKTILEKNNSPAINRIQGLAGSINSARNLASVFGL